MSRQGKIKTSGLAACVWSIIFNVATSWAITPPPWWEDPNTGSADMPLQRGKAENCRTEMEALNRAHAEALSTIRKGITPNTNLWPLIALTGSAIKFSETGKEFGQWYAWVLVQCPQESIVNARNYLYNAGTEYQQVIELFDAGRFDEALAAAEHLINRYPLGKQSVFQAERALLLASDCHVAVGRPRQAAEICQGIAVASGDQAFRHEAEMRLSYINLNYTNIVLRKVFAGKQWLVQCVTEVEGVRSEWRKMQSEVVTMVSTCGGNIRQHTGPALDFIAVRELLVSPEKCLEYMKPMSLSGIIFIIAEGGVEKRPVSGKQNEKHEYRFSGSTTCLVLAAAGKPHVFERTGITGWNPINPLMCMDILALHILNAWQDTLVKQIDQL